MPTFSVISPYAALRSDADALYRIADRAASRIRTPPTLDREDVVQDAVVAAIQLIDSCWQPPAGYPTELALILATTRKLGAKAAYYSEWQWARRRHEIGEPTAPSPGPGEDVTMDALREELLACLPPRLHATASAVFGGTPLRELRAAETTRAGRRRVVADYAAIRQRLSDLGLWIDNPANRSNRGE